MIWLRKAQGPPTGTPRIAVLFCHHRRDELTLHHLDLLRRVNLDDPSLDVIPVGFNGSDLVEGSLALRPDSRLPSNRAAHLRGQWSEIDLLMYQFALSGHIHSYDHVIFVESDCEIRKPIRQLYGPFLSHQGAAGIVRSGLRDCSDWIAWNEVSEWQRQFVGNNASGVTPLNGLLLASPLLMKISELILNSPRLFDDMISEVRVAVAARIVGADLSSIPWMEGVNDWSVGLVRDNGVGFLHPVKGIRHL